MKILDISIDLGQDFYLPVLYFQDVITRQPLNLTGWTAYSSFKAFPEHSAEVLGFFDLSFDIPSGTLSSYLSSETILTIGNVKKVLRGYWDILVYDSLNTKVYAVGGTFVINPTCTSPI